MMNLELSEALEDEYSRAGDLDVHDWRREGFKRPMPCPQGSHRILQQFFSIIQTQSSVACLTITDFISCPGFPWK